MSSRKSEEIYSDKKPKYPEELAAILPLNWTLIGNRIREERKRRGISGVELAGIINVSKGQLSNIELGKRALCADVAADIALALGVSIDYLVLGIRPVIGAGNWGLRLRSDDEIAVEIDEEENAQQDGEE